jgi:hypothetical protein
MEEGGMLFKYYLQDIATPCFKLPSAKGKRGAGLFLSRGGLLLNKASLLDNNG